MTCGSSEGKPEKEYQNQSFYCRSNFFIYIVLFLFLFQLQLIVVLAAFTRGEQAISNSKRCAACKNNFADESLKNVEDNLQDTSLTVPESFFGDADVNSINSLSASGIGGQLLGQQVEVTNHVVVPFVEYRNIPVPVPKPLPYPVHVPVGVPQPVPIPIYNKVHVPVEKPVHIIVEKPFPVKVVKEVPVPKLVPVPVRVPQPVPVPVYNKVPVPVEKPVHIIVEKPFPVKVVKEVPVPKPVPVPYPVYKTRHIHHIVHARPKHDW
ncbi:uncharacterized protein [Rhodnius prolixus]|uniref:uncharacterized protein n=1 Tax=Rhodnius prolixus TaxID=13249 RepID=UPI003D187862